MRSKLHVDICVLASYCEDCSLWFLSVCLCPAVSISCCSGAFLTHCSAALGALPRAALVLVLGLLPVHFYRCSKLHNMLFLLPQLSFRSIFTFFSGVLNFSAWILVSVCSHFPSMNLSEIFLFLSADLILANSFVD